jgi:hypothetical protein
MATIGLCMAVAGLSGARDAAGDEKEAAPRRPLRVLLVAAGPTREYQFVQTLLVREVGRKRVELSLFPQWPTPRPEQPGEVRKPEPPEQILSEFPADPEALGRYDVVVAFDPDWTKLKPEAVALVRKWIETRGGGLVIVAGPIHTPALAKPEGKLEAAQALYPVVIGDRRAEGADADTSKPHRLQFTAQAERLPYLKLDPKGEGPLAGWEEFFTGRKAAEAKKDAELLHGFYNEQPVKRAKAGATVLASLGEGRPYLVTMPLGKGRVVYLGSGEMWRLRLYRETAHERFWTGLLAYAAGRTSPAKSADTPKPPEPQAPEQLSTNDLNLEVQALQTLYHFKFTAEQMRSLAKVARETAEPPRPRKKAKASDDYRQVLLDLRSALIDANDEDSIDNLEDKLDELTESEKPTLDDDVELTAAARKHAPQVLGRLKPPQLAAYIGYVADDVADPVERVRTALAEVRGLKRDEWKTKRDEIAEEVGWLVAGVDEEKSARVSDRVVALLSKARSLTDAEFTRQQAELEKAAEEIAGGVHPAAVLEHVAEHALAELLSNPRLGAALRARFK